jgi:glycosyltransferase involved in cell wall biosynthesis
MFSLGKKKILVILPAYNEAENIPLVLSRLRETYPELDLLVIVDHSRDDTARLAHSCGAQVITLPFNLGIGGAVQTGLLYARRHGYDCAIQFDSDGQHDVGSIERILLEVVAGKAHLCIGSRFITPDAQFRSSTLRRVGIRFFSFLISILTRERLTDPTSGFRAYGREAILLFAQQYPIDFPEPESIVIANRAGLRIKEVPVVMHPRLYGNSSIRYFKSGYYMLKVTLAMILCVLRKKRRVEGDEN